MTENNISDLEILKNKYILNISKLINKYITSYNYEYRDPGNSDEYKSLRDKIKSMFLSIIKMGHNIPKKGYVFLNNKLEEILALPITEVGSRQKFYQCLNNIEKICNDYVKFKVERINVLFKFITTTLNERKQRTSDEVTLIKKALNTLNTELNDLNINKSTDIKKAYILYLNYVDFSNGTSSYPKETFLYRLYNGKFNKIIENYYGKNKLKYAEKECEDILKSLNIDSSDKLEFHIDITNEFELNSAEQFCGDIYSSNKLKKYDQNISKVRISIVENVKKLLQNKQRRR